MTPEKDPKIIAAKLCEFARTNFVAEGVEFDENSPLSDAGIDSFALGGAGVGCGDACAARGLRKR